MKIRKEGKRRKITVGKRLKRVEPELREKIKGESKYKMEIEVGEKKGRKLEERKG